MLRFFSGDAPAKTGSVVRLFRKEHFAPSITSSREDYDFVSFAAGDICHNRQRGCFPGSIFELKMMWISMRGRPGRLEGYFFPMRYLRLPR
jgi:hypothetical protein